MVIIDSHTRVRPREQTQHASRPVSAEGFPIEVHPELRGAYFRKIESERSPENKGITGVIRLPVPAFDPSRQFVQNDPSRAYETGPLDRPSVYVGGNGGGRELDAGLTWDRVYDEHKRPTFTDLANGSDGRDPAHRFAVSGSGRDVTLIDGHNRVVARGPEAVGSKLRELKPNHAFRPYWRTTNPGQSQDWHNPAVGHPSNKYFYPGERVRLTAREDGANRVRLEVGVAGGPTSQHFAADFTQIGFGVGKAQSFKRVNALDQFRVTNSGWRQGLEGGNVLPTTTRVDDARWESVELMRRNGAQVSLTGQNAADVRSGEHGVPLVYDCIFRRHSGQNGGERIDIRP